MQLEKGWTRGTDWVLSHFTRPRELRRGQALAIVGCMVAGIGVADYLSGIMVSLAVFYLVPIILSVAWLGRVEGVLVAICSVLVRLAGDILSVGMERLPFATWWNSLSAILVFAFIVWLFSSLIGLYRQLEQRVEERTLQLTEAAKARRRLENELLQIGSRERNAFGQELHDDICQHLIGTAMAAQVLSEKLSEQKSAAAADASAIVKWVEEGATKARRLASGLLLSSIEPEQLNDKLGQLAEQANGGEIECSFHKEGDTILPDPESSAQIFRIAQEALRNALKHSQARHVSLSLLGDDKSICLVVEDDGRGISESGMSGEGMGLRIMAHRASLIGATVTVTQASRGGTRVNCQMPRNTAP